MATFRSLWLGNHWIIYDLDSSEERIAVGGVIGRLFVHMYRLVNFELSSRELGVPSPSPLSIWEIASATNRGMKLRTLFLADMHIYAFIHIFQHFTFGSLANLPILGCIQFLQSLFVFRFYSHAIGSLISFVYKY